MTTPIRQGFPDWGRRLTRVDEVYLFNEVIVAGNGTLTEGPFAVAGVPALGVVITTNTGRIEVTFRFAMDQALTQVIRDEAVTMAIGGDFDGHIPVLGPWVQVRVQGLVANATASVTVYTANAPASPLDGIRNVLITQNANAIAIGATETVEGLHTWPGLAHWTCKAENQRMTFTLRMRSLSGTDTIIDTIDLLAGTSERSHLVALGARIPVVQVVNSSGAASNWDSYLVAVPFMTMG